MRPGKYVCCKPSYTRDANVNRPFGTLASAVPMGGGLFQRSVVLGTTNQGRGHAIATLPRFSPRFHLNTSTNHLSYVFTIIFFTAFLYLPY